MKQTSVERNGRSQLIPGVRPTYLNPRAHVTVLRVLLQSPPGAALVPWRAAAEATMLVRTLLVGMTMLWLPEGLRAEERGTVAVGSRVRVTWHETGAQLIGQVVALEPGLVVLGDEGGIGEQRVRVAQSTTFEVSSGKKSQTARGAMIGTAVGAMPGLLMTFGDYNTDKGNPAAVSLVGAAAGAAIGALVGLAFKAENWLPARAPVVTAGIAPIPSGASMLLSVSWGRASRQR